MGRKNWDLPNLLAVPTKGFISTSPRLLHGHVDHVRLDLKLHDAAVPERPVEVAFHVLWVLTSMPQLGQSHESRVAQAILDSCLRVALRLRDEGGLAPVPASGTACSEVVPWSAPSSSVVAGAAQTIRTCMV